MSTLPPPFVKEFPQDSVEKQVYTLVENFAQYLPIPNDRNRLGYYLFKFVTGEGDDPAISLKSSKVTIQGISLESLAQKLDEGLKQIKR